MKPGLSLVDLAQKIEENRELKADYVVPAARVRMELDDEHKPTLVFPTHRGEDVTTDIRPTAHGQLATYTGVPSKYYDRMKVEAPELLRANVNRWLSASSDRRMIRTLAGSSRAWLSDRYQRVENEEIANVVLPILMEKKAVIRSCEVTEHKLYIHASLPSLVRKVEGSVRKGDIVEAGVRIANSEVGFGAVSVDPWALFLACLNGMKMPVGGLRRNHVGRRISEGDDLNAIFADDTRKADDRALLLKVRDVVNHAFDEAAFTSAIDNVSGLTQAKITGDPSKAVELLAKKMDVGEGEKGGILRALIEGADLSAFGLVNAVTVQAHSVEDYDRAVEFNDLGGKLLTLPTSEWKEVLEAA